MSATYQPLRGFRDLYPQDKAVQMYIFDKVREVAKLYGYEEYDGPIVEPVDLYVGKTSKELLERQTFQVKGKDEVDQWILRPEMTPTLARMVAAKSQELVFPLRLFNIGTRFRYEAPQKGRSREFWQIDFDLLGNDSILADAEILSILVTFFQKLGLSKNDITIYLNSRSYMQRKLQEVGVADDKLQETLSEIDRMDKKEVSLPNQITELIRAQIVPDEDPYFKSLFAVLSDYGIQDFFKISPAVVRGLDYYTGLVFEVKDNDTGMKRSILGGGRYNNLVAKYNPSANIQGVGFAVSDVILMEILKNKQTLPTISSKMTKVLVTIFDEDTETESIEVANSLRQEQINTELYPYSDKKLDKQLKYANKANIPYAVILGPEEIQKGIYKLKNLNTQKQDELSLKKLIATVKT